MLDFPYQNGVLKRRNRTLMDMVRSKKSNAKLPQFLWIEVLNMAVYILNRVSIKAFLKTPFELLNGWKPKKKLNPKNGYFIGYAEKSKGYRFYCPIHNIRILESRNAKFLENDLIRGSGQFQDVFNKKDHFEAQPSRSCDRMIIIHTPQIKLLMRNNKIKLNNN
ncbi:hypothetical protein CR513_47054, partial [Mucuna pruriens]